MGRQGAVHGERLVALAPMAERLAEFRLEGRVDGIAVRAEWDGRWLVVSEALYRRGLLAQTVDDVFVDAGLAGTGRPSTVSGPPSDVALTLARCCDTLGAVEYSLGQSRDRRK
jgi:hypothetical protein